MKGDQLYVYRNLWNQEGVYQHHGIDCGDGTVIHYRKPSEIVEKTTFAVFSRGNPVSIKNYSQGFCFIPEVVVSRAESRLGEDKYNFLFNNCEHFATWCKTGISDSIQIRNFVPAMGKFNTSKLSDLIKRSLKKTDNRNGEQLMQDALHDIKTVWEQVQPEYKQTLQEITSWEKVAKQALQQNREDLARAALVKKRNYQQKAWDLEAQLNDLATMTENLIIN
ncbi:Phage shock protein A (PspA) family protein [Hyella patelloides LEGE 07179]|uniref:Phage shock protein A (PspA) family protein n=2 Tax=Hyella TaxID=945733 RepID=A0A563VP24_9CYAN|nr:lecithin retinol acyltransferase family protein [Hyella patelloides]VEP13218.1 Phage shock protein A (PspA) family protein [Hyella patelloides LEGE 07179]